MRIIQSEEMDLNNMSLITANEYFYPCIWPLTLSI